MDEVSLSFDIPLNRPVDAKDAPSIIRKTSRLKNMHYIDTLVCPVDGTKLSPLLMYLNKKQINKCA
jgi:hypothetical protein